MKNTLTLCVLFLVGTIAATASNEERSLKIEPAFWWTEMPMEELQLQIYAPNIGEYRASIDSEFVRIKKQILVDSPNYLFLYLSISSETPAGDVQIVLKNGSDTIKVDYPLIERESLKGRNLGFDSSDSIYLMLPDRFANGDESNDSIPGMLEAADRTSPFRRQGGDLKGIEKQLSYINELGMTALWLTPILENDMPIDYGAYHGYAVTDLYKIDRRFGSNEQYKELVKKAHESDLKVIMDMIHNHIGINHWWMKDLPSEDWVHDFQEHGTTSFRGSVASDAYASEYDKDKLVKGWFVKEMPDLNQRNTLLADYLIQNTIWWIEYSGIDGIRMDTYLYSYPEFMARWCQEVLQAYPNFNIVGESWVQEVSHVAFWQKDELHSDDGYQSNLPSVLDFPLTFALRKAFTETFSNTTGLSQLYYILAQDSLYSDANNNVIFLDNHDMGRFFSEIGHDVRIFKMAYAFLMTCRGIPQIYYGSELMLPNVAPFQEDESWRQTMAGGWSDDERNTFSTTDRTEEESERFSYISKLTNWRKTSEAVHKGDFKHFIPQDNVYVYFRIHKNKSVMVVLNMNETHVSIETERFYEILKNHRSATNILTEESFDASLSNFRVEAKSALILELD